MVKEKNTLVLGAQKLSDLLFTTLTAALALCVFIMLVLVFGNVVLRYAFNSGIDISSEVARLCFVWVTFAGAVLAFRTHSHLAINMFVDRLSPQTQKVIHLARQLLILWILYLVITGGWQQTLIGMRTVTPVTGMPISVFGSAVLFSGVAMAVMGILDFFVALATPATAENIKVFHTSVDSIEEL